MKTFLWLLSFLRAFSGWIFLSVLLGSAAIASGIGLLGTSAYLIASAAQHPSIASLQVAIVGVRFFGINRGVMRYLERLTTHNVTFRLLSVLRAWFFKTIEPLAPAHIVQYKSGDLLSRSIADIETLENFYVRVISPPLIAIIITAGTGYFAAALHSRLGWALVIGLILTFQIWSLRIFG